MQFPVDITIARQRSLPGMLGGIARYSFYGTLILLPFRWRVELLARPNEPIYKDYTDFLLFLPDIMLLFTLTAWGLGLWMERKPVRLGPFFISVPLAGLTLVGLLSVIFSVDHLLSLYHALRFCLLFLFYLFIVNERVSILKFGIPIGIGGVIQSIVAIGQSITQGSLGLQMVGEYALDPAWFGVSIVSDGVSRFLRAYGLTDHPNILGGCLAFALIVQLTMYLHGGRKVRWLAAILFAVLIAGLWTTFSRAAWLAFLAGSGLIVVMEAGAHRIKVFKPVSLLAAVSLLILLPFILSQRSYLGARLNTGNSFSTIAAEARSMEERLFLNGIANSIFARHPLTGVGLGASPVAMKNEYPEFPTYYQPPHFTLLAAATETGILGALFYFLLMILPWLMFLRRRRLWKEPGLIGTAGLLLAVTVVGLFDYYTWFGTAGRLWQWLAWGSFAEVISPAVQKEMPKGE